MLYISNIDDRVLSSEHLKPIIQILTNDGFCCAVRIDTRVIVRMVATPFDDATHFVPTKELLPSTNRGHCQENEHCPPLTATEDLYVII
jgi:hypothetical protein